MSTSLSRRTFIGGSVKTGTALSLGLSSGFAANNPPATSAALASGTASPPPPIEWPVWDAREESALLDVLRTGKWSRAVGGTRVREFEVAFAETMRAKFCVATSSGTTALLTTIGALDIGPGDEVILPPYTFVATFNVITAFYALPVFVDSDLATFQVDPKKIPAAITPATKLMLPVHIGGYAADLDALDNISRKHRVPYVADACQAHLAEWRGRPVGPQGLGGCFSFQGSKNLPSGEGGAVVTDDEDFANRCYAFHTPTGPRPGIAPTGRGANFRLTEFQAGLLLAQLSRLEAQVRIRDANAAYLTSLLRQIPGITPAPLTNGCTRSAYHAYLLRYDKSHFADLPRSKFLQALSRENIPVSSLYTPLNTSAHVKAIASNPHYQRIYGKAAMANWSERNRCPVNDRLCEEAFRISHVRLLRDRKEMERIAEVVAGVQKRAGELARA